MNQRRDCEKKIPFFAMHYAKDSSQSWQYSKYTKFFVQAATLMIRVIHFDSISSFVAQRDFYFYYLAP
jgi:hypothetical protein